MSLEAMIGAVLIAGLTVYCLTGGADFGGGILDLFATGPRANDQRKLIASEIGPIWEANHVWLIVLIVILFIDFPIVYAAISTALHWPLLVMLVGIVLRGSGFVFRAYGSSETTYIWGRVFAAASLMTPFSLGVILGAITSPALDWDGHKISHLDGILPWLRPFPIMMGILTLLLFSFLAAVYLGRQAPSQPLQDDFRRRALTIGGLLVITGGICLFMAYEHAPQIAEKLETKAHAIPWLTASTISMAACMWMVWHHRWNGARRLAAGTAILVILGWAFSQYPYLIYPEITISDAAAPPKVLSITLWSLGLGASILTPSFILLFRVFNAAGRHQTTSQI